MVTKSIGPLERWRKKQGIPRAEVARIVGVSENTVARWENGTSMPAWERVLVVAQMMEINPAALKKKWEAWRGKA